MTVGGGIIHIVLDWNIFSNQQWVSGFYFFLSQIAESSHPASSLNMIHISFPFCDVFRILWFSFVSRNRRFEGSLAFKWNSGRVSSIAAKAFSQIFPLHGERVCQLRSLFYVSAKEQEIKESFNFPYNTPNFFIFFGNCIERWWMEKISHILSLTPPIMLGERVKNWFNSKVFNRMSYEEAKYIETTCMYKCVCVCVFYGNFFSFYIEYKKKEIYYQPIFSIDSILRSKWTNRLEFSSFFPLYVSII